MWAFGWAGACKGHSLAGTGDVRAEVEARLLQGDFPSLDELLRGIKDETTRCFPGVAVV